MLVKQVLQAYRITARDLARILGVTRPAVYAWTAGRNQPSHITQAVLERMLAAHDDPESFARAFEAIKESSKQEPPESVKTLLAALFGR